MVVVELVVLDVVVVVLVEVVLLEAGGLLPAGLVVVVEDGRRVTPGDDWGKVVDVVLDDDVLEVGNVEEVLDDVVEVVGADVVPSRRSRSRLSGDAVCTGSTANPATADFMAAAQICAGKDPPVTRRPCTSVMGTIRSGCPTQTAVESWGTNPTNQASP